MIATAVGTGNVLIGLAYCGLGLLSAWETLSLHRYRGWSRFGIGFSLMAASCGPHHLVHGIRTLQVQDAGWPLLAVTLIGLPAGFAFVGLRFETALGGRGDRSIGASRYWATSVAAAFAVVAGLVAGWALAGPAGGLPVAALCTPSGLASAPGPLALPIDVTALDRFANLFVVATYGMVGWYLADYQVRRQAAEGAWSMSGVSLAGVFFSCALMHFVYATSAAHLATLPFDLLGIPASIYFLWVVRRVHADSVVDWNRRPLVGVATAPGRPSPWSGDYEPG
jgi:hypothetical protein